MASQIPQELLVEFANVHMRRFHYLWHAVRRRDVLSTLSNPGALGELCWKAAFEGQPTSGLAFLQMHRLMVNHYRNRYYELVGEAPSHWGAIPDSSTSAEWPLPADSPYGQAPDFQKLKREWLALQNTRLREKSRLRRLTLDRYGSLLETGVHSWMHRHWAGAKPLDPFGNDLQNDWLPGAYSSHVNPIFWQLHGWVDDCIGIWAECNEWSAAQVGAQLAKGWIGPPEASTHMHHGHADVPDEVWALVIPPGGGGPKLFWM